MLRAGDRHSEGEPETIKYQQKVFDLASSWTLPICPSWVGHQSGSGLCALSAEGACYVPGTDTASGLAAWKETHTELPTQCVNTTIFPEYQCPYPGVDVKCKFPMLPTQALATCHQRRARAAWRSGRPPTRSFRHSASCRQRCWTTCAPIRGLM